MSRPNFGKTASMNKRTTLIGGAVAAALLLLPGIASASFVLDTGTPSGTGAPALLNSAQWEAAEFTATAGVEITSVSAYLTQGLAFSGAQFTFDIYSSTGFTGRSSGRTLLDSIGGTYTADGWSTTAIDWTPTATANYWLAVQVSSTVQNNGLDLPVETSTSTGTVPALAFAYLGTGTESEFTESGAPAVGLEVTAVPLPPAVWLLGSGLLGLGAIAGRRRHGRKSPQTAGLNVNDTVALGLA
jgi:hypothetical protein